MLAFLTTAPHAYTLRVLLERGGTALTRRVVMMDYGEFLSWRRLPAQTYVLADVDRLDEGLRRAVAHRLEALRAAVPQVRVLNDPLRTLGRTGLLQTLHRMGVNQFRALPVEHLDPATIADLRFPVFLRHAVEHDGPSSGLLHDAAQLTAAVAAMRAAGTDLRSQLVVEFVDVRNHAGLFEKYSAMRIGDAIFASERAVHTHWVCKGVDGEFSSDPWRRRDLEFQLEDPHTARLRPLFEAGGVDYGRIDYAFVGEALQVFEINTNPYIDLPPGSAAPRDGADALRIERYVQAMLDLIAQGPARGTFQAVPGAVGPDRVQGPSPLRRAVRRTLRSLHALHLEHEVWRLRWRLLPPAR